MKFLKTLLLFLSVFLLFFSSCKKDELLTDSSAKLDIYTDSVFFDTVFTSVGSTTKVFTIHNTHTQALNISKIHLGKGTSSPFLLNVDGVSGSSISDVEIAGGDSLYVFVQVFIDPLNSASPLLVNDSVVFETNGNVQDVKLIAIGQDVYLHIPNHFTTNGFPAYSITGRSDHDTTLPSDKPHLFFGYTFIDSRCKLTISAGTKCYFHKGAVLVAYDSATLFVDGSYGNVVKFEGDRLEPDYKDIPGQWGKIWLWPGSKNNVIKYAVIKNGSIGVEVDSNVVATGNPTLVLSNTIIENMGAAAIYTTHAAQIRSWNCVFANCGQYVAALTGGGKFNFQQCTFANYWSISTRTTPILAFNNYYQINSTTFIRNLDSCYFGNCIIHGDIDDEINIDSMSGGTFSYKFDFCMLKTTMDVGADPIHFVSPYKNFNPAFVDVVNNDYHLTAGSPAINAGNPAISIQPDLDNNFRGPSPDLGAYEKSP
jgi:hypothetical protein